MLVVFCEFSQNNFHTGISLPRVEEMKILFLNNLNNFYIDSINRISGNFSPAANLPYLCNMKIRKHLDIFIND